MIKAPTFLWEKRNGEKKEQSMIVLKFQMLASMSRLHDIEVS
jgi:hypothetical protein